MWWWWAPRGAPLQPGVCYSDGTWGDGCGSVWTLLKVIVVCLGVASAEGLALRLGAVLLLPASHDTVALRRYWTRVLRLPSGGAVLEEVVLQRLAEASQGVSEPVAWPSVQLGRTPVRWFGARMQCGGVGECLSGSRAGHRARGFPGVLPGARFGAGGGRPGGAAGSVDGAALTRGITHYSGC